MLGELNAVAHFYTYGLRVTIVFIGNRLVPGLGTEGELIFVGIRYLRHRLSGRNGAILQHNGFTLLFATNHMSDIFGRICLSNIIQTAADNARKLPVHLGIDRATYHAGNAEGARLGAGGTDQAANINIPFPVVDDVSIRFAILHFVTIGPITQHTAYGSVVIVRTRHAVRHGTIIDATIQGRGAATDSTRAAFSTAAHGYIAFVDTIFNLVVFLCVLYTRPAGDTADSGIGLVRIEIDGNITPVRTIGDNGIVGIAAMAQVGHIVIVSGNTGSMNHGIIIIIARAC